MKIDKCPDSTRIEEKLNHFEETKPFPMHCIWTRNIPWKNKVYEQVSRQSKHSQQAVFCLGFFFLNFTNGMTTR